MDAGQLRWTVRRVGRVVQDPIDLKTKYGISSGNLSKSSVKVNRQSLFFSLTFIYV